VTDPALSQFIGVLREAAAAMRVASGKAGLPLDKTLWAADSSRWTLASGSNGRRQGSEPAGEGEMMNAKQRRKVLREAVRIAASLAMIVPAAEAFAESMRAMAVALEPLAGQIRDINAGGYGLGFPPAA
jgi:hypothetical protein